MLPYPSAVALSSRTLNHLADLIRAERTRRRGRWRRLDAGRPCSPWPICVTVTPSLDWPAASRSASPRSGGTSEKPSTCSPRTASTSATESTCRSSRTARDASSGLAGPARRCARPDRRPHPLPGRRADQRQRDDLRRQGAPRRRRQHPHAVQAPPSPATIVPPAEDRQPAPSQDPRCLRARRRHPQGRGGCRQGHGPPALVTACSSASRPCTGHRRKREGTPSEGS